MIDRICISINNRCNLACKYCHFNEKGKIGSEAMNVYEILDNVKRYACGKFKIGFVGNGEPFLDWSLLKEYLRYIEDCPNISAYTITNGTVRLADDDWKFLEEHRINVGFSIDGYRELHNINRCGSFDIAIGNVEYYKMITGHYPTFNATVGRESLKNAQKVIEFFKPYGTRVTFSRMIGKDGIRLDEYRRFLEEAEKVLPVRRGGMDCTMYGGQCGSGMNNFFFANGNVYYCGNCIDLPPLCPSNSPFDELEKITLNYKRNYCYRETICE